VSTLANETIETGDIIELKLDNEQWATAMVLLATPEAVILDLLDDSTPIVVRVDEIAEFRNFTAAV
jgi:hypothetical protein